MLTLGMNWCKLVLEVINMKSTTKDQFSKNLAFFMKLKGVDRNTLSNDLNIKYTTQIIRKWV